MNYYVYEIFDPTGGYCLYIHRNKETFDIQFDLNIGEEGDHYRVGTIFANSPQHAIQRLADDEWLYEEYNAP